MSLRKSKLKIRKVKKKTENYKKKLKINCNREEFKDLYLLKIIFRNER